MLFSMFPEAQWYLTLAMLERSWSYRDLESRYLQKALDVLTDKQFSPLKRTEQSKRVRSLHKALRGEVNVVVYTTTVLLKHSRAVSRAAGGSSFRRSDPGQLDVREHGRYVKNALE